MPNLEETILAARKEQAQGNWRQALGLYSKILNEEPQYLDLYLERSECLIRLDSYSLAFKDLTKIMNTTDIEKNYSIIYMNYANKRIITF